MKEFYRFWEGHQEAWDGPALLVWSDGKRVGACLDRNGLRPARYMTLKDGTVLMMSETGVVPVDEAEVRTVFCALVANDNLFGRGRTKLLLVSL